MQGETSALWRLDAVETASLIRARRISSREVTEAVLARCMVVNPRLNAVVLTLAEEALAAADAADAAQASGELLGALHGVPVTTKVNVDQASCPTDGGVAASRAAIAAEDSAVVANLRRAGAILIGRTNAPAFSMRLTTENALHGRTLNPLDPIISPGGSSGGAGAATAAGIGAIAHGNDIGGSIRIPAYCCGVAGLRPTVGRVPHFNPSLAEAPRPMASLMMAVQGPHARSVRDLRLALEVMAAHPERRDPRWVDVPLQGPPLRQPLKVALVAEPPDGFTHPAQAEAVRQAGRHLAASGYVVEEVSPPDLARAATLWHRIVVTELFSTLLPRMERAGEETALLSFRHWLALHPPQDIDGLIGAWAERDVLQRRWLAFFRTWPLVVLPTLADLPMAQDEDLTLGGQRRVLDSLRTALVAPTLGLPGVAVPVGSVGRLRTGVQVMAAPFREDLCLGAAEAIEAGEGGPARVVDPDW